MLHRYKTQLEHDNSSALQQSTRFPFHRASVTVCARTCMCACTRAQLCCMEHLTKRLWQDDAAIDKHERVGAAGRPTPNKGGRSGISSFFWKTSPIIKLVNPVVRLSSGRCVRENMMLRSYVLTSMNKLWCKLERRGWWYCSNSTSRPTSLANFFPRWNQYVPM